MKQTLLIAVLFLLVSCGKDITEYREYALGLWMQENCEGEPIPGAERDIIFFKDYMNYELQTPFLRPDTNIVEDKCYEGGFYTIYCKLFTGMITTDCPWISEDETEVQLYEEWELQRFTNKEIRARVISKEYDYKAWGLDSGKVFTYVKLNPASLLGDSLNGIWTSVSCNNEKFEDLKIEFMSGGSYTLSSQQDSLWTVKSDENGSFVVYDYFLRTRSFNNLWWGKENLWALAGWKISYTHREDKFYLNMDSLDAPLSYVFSKDND